jgi:hypothetical protein
MGNDALGGGFWRWSSLLQIGWLSGFSSQVIVVRRIFSGGDAFVAPHKMEKPMHPITLHQDPEAVATSGDAVFYRGEFAGRPITVVATLDDLLHAEPQLDGEPIEWTVRLVQHIERVANHYVEAGREPEESNDGFRLPLTRNDLISWRVDAPPL